MNTNNRGVLITIAVLVLLVILLPTLDLGMMGRGMMWDPGMRDGWDGWGRA